MIKLKDRVSAFFYKLLRSDASNGYNECKKCKKIKRNWAEIFFKDNYLIGYDKILSEWVMFPDYNVYAKIWVMNGYTINIYKLTNNLWTQISGLCRHCISDLLKDHKEPEEE